MLKIGSVRCIVLEEVLLDDAVLNFSEISSLQPEGGQERVPGLSIISAS